MHFNRLTLNLRPLEHFHIFFVDNHNSRKVLQPLYPPILLTVIDRSLPTRLHTVHLPIHLLSVTHPARSEGDEARAGPLILGCIFVRIFSIAP